MKVLILAVAMVMSSAAFAQKHMVQFGTDNVTIGNLAWETEKTRGNDSVESKSQYVFANYAMALTSHIQVGVKADIFRNQVADEKSTSYGLQIGGVYNLNTDFRKSLYASLYVGWDWDHANGDDFDIERDETFKTTFAVGKRYPLSFISENVTYSPEVAFVSSNPTTSSDTEWTQSLEFRILQFAVFF